MARRPKTRSTSVPTVDPALENQIMVNLGESDLIDPTVGTSSKEATGQPGYQIYEGSRIPVSKAVGKSWKAKFEAAIVAYDTTWKTWEEVFRYYNHHQVKENDTPRGRFRRGDMTENLVFANINTILPAVYSKYPDFTCNAINGEQDDFCKAMSAYLNAITRRPSIPIGLKAKAKKQALMAELTNLGVLKLDYQLKDESRELTIEEMSKLTDQFAKAKTMQEVDELTGKLMALETQAEAREPKGFKLTNVLPMNVVPDPYAEQDDGMDALWFAEIAMLPTEYLNQRFTQKAKDGDGRVLIYKPSHKALFTNKHDNEDDPFAGVILEQLTDTNRPISHTDEERLAYLQTYMTEVVYIWDKVTRRIFLFDRRDWTWPIWVWDDYMNLSRFYPYFVLQFVLSTGGVISPGVASYYLDQQDAINDINRQVALLRRRAFDFAFYNSEKLSKQEVDSMMDAMAGRTQGTKKAIGVKLEPNQKFDEIFQPVGLPTRDQAAYFDKADLYSAVDRLAATSDALRGAQFKANTTEDAVQAYIDATRLRIGAKVDASEECLSALGYSMAELAVQFVTQEEVAAIIGQAKAAAWTQMSVQEFNAAYSIEVVAGSTEKPNSIFKKKEAVQVAQTVGQFVKAAPGSSLIIALKVLKNAFTEINISSTDWDMINQEIMQQLGGQPGGGQPGQSGVTYTDGQGGQQIDRAALEQLPPAVKEQALRMRDEGASEEEILAFMQQHLPNGSAQPRSNGNGKVPATRPSQRGHERPGHQSASA